MSYLGGKRGGMGKELRRWEEAAEQRLRECTADGEKARQDIRARGEAELDSLLVVGNDSVSHMLCY